MNMWKQVLLSALLIGKTSGAQPYAQLTPLKTKASSASSHEHDLFTKCAGDLYFAVASLTSSDDSTNGLYRFDESDTSTHSTQLVTSLGKIRGLTCHEKHLYYFKQDKSDTWGLYRFSLGSSGVEEFIHDASEFMHEPLVNYESELFIGARGPKLYKLTLTTDSPNVGVVWEAPTAENKEIYPESMYAHKGEQFRDLYFVAPNSDNHPTLWKFNVQTDEATQLKDLVLRTGDSDATIAEMISYKGTQDFASLLYFSLGSFDNSDGHHRLARWEADGSLPVLTLVMGYDPTHLTIFQDDLYMVLRKPKDITLYGVWRWNGRFVTEVFSLPNEGKISHMTVWDDILVVSGDSGPLVVWNGEQAETVTASAKLAGVSGMIDYQGNLLLAATEDPSDKGNGLWSLTKGVWKDPHQENNLGEDGSDSSSGSSGSGSSGSSGSSGNTSGSGNKGSGSGSSAPDSANGGTVTGNTAGAAFSKEVSGSGKGGGAKAVIVLFVLGLVGGLCFWAYKTKNKVEHVYDSKSKNSWTRSSSNDAGVMA